MASAPGLTEAQIREFALPERFARGRESCERGAVSHLRRRGAELQAAVAGSQDTPYQVHVTLAERGLASAGCTCPSAESREGACKRGPTNSATRRAADGGERGAQEHTPAW
jgi:uncharacterized Zn finger protein